MTLTLPILSRSRDVPGQFQYETDRFGLISVMATALLSFPLIVFGDLFVQLAFGKRYGPSIELVGILTVVQSINVLRTWAMSSLVAHSATRRIPYANATRVIGLVLATVIAIRTRDLLNVGYCLVVGEVAGLIVLVLVSKRVARTGTLSTYLAMTILGAGWAIVLIALPGCDTIFARTLLCLVPLSMVITVIAILYRRLKY